MNIQTREIPSMGLPNKGEFFSMVANTIKSRNLVDLDINAEKWLVVAKFLDPKTDDEKKIFGYLARAAIRVRRKATEAEVAELQRRIIALNKSFLHYREAVEMDELALTF